MPPTVRLYLTISSIRVEKVRVGKLPRNWAVGWVTGSPAWTPWSGTKWVSLTQLLPKVKFSSLPIPKKKGNIYLFHILFFPPLNSIREVGYCPLAVLMMTARLYFPQIYGCISLIPPIPTAFPNPECYSLKFSRSDSNAVSHPRLSPVLPTP